ncbi:hypothetical protein L6164_027716 [Bauhinia variegata]|uniref:Uncharacterized protein n=1 Tax=Bauhinia variegata TaxID=167791 RepID=A0ACB9LV62_BAUVA|nr:hypothetical protein L6164_027716 [Bauhinia variegata]
MELSRSFRMSRSHDSILLSESVTSECAKINGYERLSQSMRLSGEIDLSDGRKRNKRGFGLLSRVFAFSRITAHERSEVAAEKSEKKRSSWLPDPNRRWPIQGW